jgi:hypothetical protein
MPAARLSAILLLACRGLAAPALSVDVSSLVGWNQDQVSRFQLRSEDVRFVAGAWQPAGASTARLFAGLSSSWLRAGPLSPAGVIREACNPLGFRAGSDVFLQRSGLVLDTSLPARQPGVLLMPAPRSLGVFYQPLPAGGDWAGCVAGFFPVPDVGAEGFFCVAGPPPGKRGEEWIADSAPCAGGRVLCGAGRFVLDSAGFGMSAAVGASGSEMCLPGTFIHLHLVARLDPLTLFFLFGKADASFTSPAGDRPRDAVLVSAAARLEEEALKAQARFSHSVRQAGFTPQPFLADRTEVDLRVERVLALAGDALLCVAVDGGKTIRGSPDGSQEPDFRCGVAATLRIAPATLEAGVEQGDAGGLSAKAGIKATLDHYGSQASLDGAVLHVDRGARSFSALASARFSRRTFSVTLSAGMDDVRFTALPQDAGKRLRLSLQVGSRSP